MNETIVIVFNTGDNEHTEALDRVKDAVAALKAGGKNAQVHSHHKLREGYFTGTYIDDSVYYMGVLPGETNPIKEFLFQ